MWSSCIGRPTCKWGKRALRMLHLQLHLQATSQSAGHSTYRHATLQGAACVGTPSCCMACCFMVAACDFQEI